VFDFALHGQAQCFCCSLLDLQQNPEPALRPLLLPPVASGVQALAVEEMAHPGVQALAVEEMAHPGVQALAVEELAHLQGIFCL
jgi:hypothetical protein